MPNRVKIGELLIKSGKINEAQLQEALKAKQNHEKIGDVLIAKGYISEQVLYEQLSIQHSIPLISLQEKNVDKDLLQHFNNIDLREKMIFPVSATGALLKLAMADPLDEKAIDEIESTLNMRVMPMLAKKSEIMRYITKHLESDRSMNKLLNRAETSLGENIDIIYQEIIEMAKQKNATFVHFTEAEDGYARATIRINNEVYPLSIPKCNYRTLYKYLKGFYIKSDIEVAPHIGYRQRVQGVSTKYFSSQYEKMTISIYPPIQYKELPPTLYKPDVPLVLWVGEYEKQKAIQSDIKNKIAAENKIVIKEINFNGKNIEEAVDLDYDLFFLQHRPEHFVLLEALLYRQKDYQTTIYQIELSPLRNIIDHLSRVQSYYFGTLKDVPKKLVLQLNCDNYGEVSHEAKFIILDNLSNFEKMKEDLLRQFNSLNSSKFEKKQLDYFLQGLEDF